MSGLKLVVFDCDGTLVDSQHMIVDAMRSAFMQFGRTPPDRTTILSIVGLSLPEALSELTSPDDPDLLGLIEGYKAAFQHLRTAPIHMEPLYEGARNAIETLAARDDVILGLATGKSRRGVNLVLGHHALLDHFSTIQTSDGMPSKPHPAMLHQAMQEVGIAPEATVMVGDTSFDMAMAKAAGVTALGVDWGYHPMEDLTKAGAEAILTHFDEVVPWLEMKWQGRA